MLGNQVKFKRILRLYKIRESNETAKELFDPTWTGKIKEKFNKVLNELKRPVEELLEEIEVVVNRPKG